MSVEAPQQPKPAFNLDLQPKRFVYLAKYEILGEPVVFLGETVIIAKSRESAPVAFSEVAAQSTVPAIPAMGLEAVDLAFDKAFVSQARKDNMIIYTLRSKDWINDIIDRYRRPRRPRRPRCHHGKLKVEPCQSCEKEKITKRKPLSLFA